MVKVERIEIGGFRGIYKPPLELNFEKANDLQSMIIYGRNGTGKSSIVDGFEWLLKGRIAHLAREGAGPSAYPHREASGDDTYVEVVFGDDELGTIRKEYDFDTITQPNVVEGSLDEVVEKIQQLPILRYRDIRSFVYKTKAEKYSFLAENMGLEEPKSLQDDLQTTVNRLEDKLSTEETRRDEARDALEERTGVESPDRSDVLQYIDGQLETVAVEPTQEDVSQLPDRWQTLRGMVEEDEKTERLSRLRSAKDQLDQLFPLPEWEIDPSTLEERAEAYEEVKDDLADLVLHDLYQAGEEAIEHTGDPQTCPLCGKRYEEGDLLEHIRSQRQALEELAQQRDEIEEAHEAFQHDLETLADQLDRGAPPSLEEPPSELYEQTREAVATLSATVETVQDALGDSLQEMDTDHPYGELKTSEAYQTLEEEDDLRDSIDGVIETLEDDDHRTRLVDAFEEVRDTWDEYEELVVAEARAQRAEDIRSAFEEVRSEFVDNVHDQMTSEFQKISQDVADIFNILERDHSEITDPRVTFPEGEDKAVVLEAKLGGETVSPAYSQLSESQLNSFGLSVFLASVRTFNPSFDFIVLDDVINSFDAYKRPRVIEVLNEEFDDKQILLLTHDKIWTRQLTRSNPKWVRKRFAGWDYGIGPSVREGGDDLDRIQELIEEDRPGDAGRRFGVYLEWILKELCENMQASLKYREAQDYTLHDLLVALRKRVGKKTDRDDLAQELEDFEDSTWFRNFSAHWKEPDIEITPEELEDHMTRWESIEEELRCTDCGRLVTYEKDNGHEHVACPCRELSIAT